MNPTTTFRVSNPQKKKQINQKMVLLDHLWDDVVAGPQPERGLKHLKKNFTQPLNVKGDRFNPHRSLLFLLLLVFLCVIDDLQILILTLFFRIYVYDEWSRYRRGKQQEPEISVDAGQSRDAGNAVADLGEEG